MQVVKFGFNQPVLPHTVYHRNGYRLVLVSVKGRLLAFDIDEETTVGTDYSDEEDARADLLDRSESQTEEDLVPDPEEQAMLAAIEG